MKKIAALLVFVMIFALNAPAMAAYRTGSAVGDAAAYGAGGAAGVWVATAGFCAVELIEKGANAALWAAY